MPPAARAAVTRAVTQAVTWFTLFNLIAVPLIGRGVWALMLAFAREDFRLVSVLVSVLGAVAILGVNAWLTRRAARAGLGRRGQMVMWLVTGGTFALTIGFGTFSPINLLIALVGSAAR